MSFGTESITDNLNIWTSAVEMKSASGRGKSNKLELYGIKKLRELILELAVRGLLVPQDPNDEPASELLKKIAAEKAQLVNDGKIKKPKASPPIEDEEKPFELQEGWEWIRLREVGHDWGQKQPEDEFTYIDVSAINKELGHIDEPAVLQASEAPSRARKIVQNGTVIYSTVRPYLLNIAVIDRDFDPEPIASTAFAIIHPFAGVSASYIYRYLRSPAFVQYVENVQIGIAYPAINDKQFFSGLIPVPPTAEQARIVAKVDELMALCDQLEQQQETSITTRHTLVQTLLDALTTASDRDGFSVAWERIADHYDTLFTTEWSIHQLKKTILQLAVMGKLVPQDSSDEPASELLKRIATEKAKLAKAGKVKKQKALPPVKEHEKPFALPNGWEWCRLGSVGIGATGKTPDTKESKYYDGDIQFIGPGQITPNGELFSSDKTLTEAGLSESVEALPGDILMVCIGGSIGKNVVSNMRVAFNQQINKISPLFSNPNYLNIALSTEMFYESVLKNASGSATPIINRSKWENLYIPIAPKNEQKRIVAKVDELLGICDQLIDKLKAKESTKLKLADTVAKKFIT